MKIIVEVKPKSKRAFIKQIDNNHFKVTITEVPIKSKANKSLINIMAKFLGIPSSKIIIEKGIKSRKKILDVAI